MVDTPQLCSTLMEIIIQILDTPAFSSSGFSSRLDGKIVTTVEQIYKLHAVAGWFILIQDSLSLYQTECNPSIIHW